MSGIFYDPRSRRLRKVRQGFADPAWTLVTHNLEAGEHQCRRILREWVSLEEMRAIDWSAAGPRPA